MASQPSNAALHSEIGAPMMLASKRSAENEATLNEAITLGQFSAS